MGGPGRRGAVLGSGGPPGVRRFAGSWRPLGALLGPSWPKGRAIDENVRNGIAKALVDIVMNSARHGGHGDARLCKNVMVWTCGGVVEMH